MHMLPQLRRTLLLLYAIPPGADICIYWGSRKPGHTASGTGGHKIVEIDERANYVAFQKAGYEQERAPLESLRSIFRATEPPNEQWKVFVELG